MLKLMSEIPGSKEIEAETLIIVPTIFPDKTSQIWKLDDEILLEIDNNFTITWEFEHEGEIIQLLQLMHLLYNRGIKANLQIPFLPYGRQDKEINNNTTFALRTFLTLLEKFKSWVGEITTIDAHNPKIISPTIKSLSADKDVQFAIEQTQCRLICFPDKSASTRGYNILEKPNFYINKKRNQETGDIEGMFLENDLYNLKEKTILIVDDICDGGRTFIEAAKLLKRENAGDIHLYVTHGIFSKGLEVLRDAGIKRIFTRKGEHT